MLQKQWKWQDMANPEDSKAVYSQRELPPEIESLNEFVEGITTDGLGSKKLMEKYSEWAENYEKVFGVITHSLSEDLILHWNPVENKVI